MASMEKHEETSSSRPIKQTVLESMSLLHEEWNKIQNLYPQSTFSVKGSTLEDYKITLRVPVSVSVDHITFVIYFRLTKLYPANVPSIHITSNWLPKSEIYKVIKLLEIICDNSIGHSMMISCIEESIHFLQQCKEGAKQLSDNKIQEKKTFSGLSEIREQSNFTYDNDCKLINPTNIARLKIGNEMKSDIRGIEKSRPNYFIAIRIADEDLIRNLVEIQNTLVKREELLSKGVIPSSALHITLCNLGLDHANDLLKAMEVLRKIKPELQNALPFNSVIIHGISQFYDRAIYAKVKVDKEYMKFRDILIEKLNESGVEFREDHDEYTPHVTLIKVRRPERRLFGTRHIRSEIYSSYLESIHGAQPFNSIFLCAMGGDKREDGFYVTPFELNFEQNKKLD